MAAACGCTIQINPPANGDSQLPSTNPLVTVVDGFGLRIRIGETNGQEEESICDGWFPVDGNHELLIDEPVLMTIRVESEDGEVQLLVRCGESMFCGTGAVEQVSRFWGTGVCEVFVGTPESGETFDYTLEFEEN